jgi:uncharacterized protein YhaN
VEGREQLEEAPQQIVMQGPPLWVYFLAPASTVVTTLLGFAAAYLLGRSQGKAQLRHDESAKAAVELERRTYEIYRDLRRFEGRQKLSTKEEAVEFVERVYDRIEKLQTYMAHSSVWLDRNVLIEALRIDDSLDELTTELLKRVKSRNQQQSSEIMAETIREWPEGFELRRSALSKEVQRLLGTGDPPLTRLRLWWRRRR